MTCRDEDCNLAGQDHLLIAVDRLQAEVHKASSLLEVSGSESERLRTLALADDCRQLIAALSDVSASIRVEADASKKRIEALVAYGMHQAHSVRKRQSQKN